MSPIEDEAVVAELLRSSQGRLELVDARQFLPDFTARPGLSSWNVLDDTEIKKKMQRRQNIAYLNRKHAESEKQEHEGSTEFATSVPPANIPVPDFETVEKVESVPTDEMIIEEEVHPDPHVASCIQLGFRLYTHPSEVPEKQRSSIKDSCFPPTEEEKEWMRLEKCLRCVPHDEVFYQTIRIFSVFDRNLMHLRIPEASLWRLCASYHQKRK